MDNKLDITTDDEEMFVTKRGGKQEVVSFDKILRRIRVLGQEANIKINYTALVMKVIDQLYNGISTAKIDELTAEQCASLSSTHPDYNILAGRITVSNHMKNTEASFSKVMNVLYNFKDKHDKHSPIVTKEFIDIVNENAEMLDALCDYNRDYLIEFFGFKTLERAYLMKVNRKIVERPQHMWLRVSIGIHWSNMDRVKETYDLMSQKYFTHATPTLFNAGTPHPQLSSCYLLAMEKDSIEGIYNTLKDCALISKWAGGIGLHIHNVRASGSHIRGTNGMSNGIVPMLKVFNNTAKYVDQCVHPETIIYTKGGPIQIRDVVPGITKVFNKTGGYEVVQKVLEHSYDAEMLRISFCDPAVPCLFVTPEHPIKSILASDINNNRTYSWNDAKDLQHADMIAFPVPTYTKDHPGLTEEICEIYGIILSGLEGTNYTTVSVRSDVERLRKLKSFLDTWYIPHKYNILSGENQITWEPNVNLPFCKSDFICSRSSKGFHGEVHCIGKRWLHLPTHKVNAILNGIGKRTLDRIETELGFLRLRAQVVSSTANSFFKYNTLFSQIDTITSIPYNGVVYDLQMGNEHNYLLQTGLVHNGGGKRNGSFAIYLEPWHADIEIFLQMRKNHGDEELKARDLFYALWMPDLFMQRVKDNKNWTLMCPDECPGLADVHSEAFVELYEKYESLGKGRKTMLARDLWFQILDAQMETGTPYLLYKDSANRKTNQQNLGTIKSSNLCSEIIEYSDENETAVCNLASIALPAFIDKSDPAKPTFNHAKLHEIVKVVTYNLNRIIDVNFYPTEKTRRSNMRHRPIGIGVQGLADVFMLMNLSFSGNEARILNKRIFETIYHGAVECSCEMAKTEGKYETFDGSPASEGRLQFDLWDADMKDSQYDWANLKMDVQNHGLRNSLLLAPMPTASTSQILGYNECIEPITSNIYNRRTIAGEFIMANKYLMHDLLKINMWNDSVKNSIIANNGSIQHLDKVPVEIREKYKTVWEMPMRDLIDMSADRGAFICQSQSLNLWLEDPNYNSLTSMHFYSWSKGLKTGIYYLRRRARHQAQQFTIEPDAKVVNNDEPEICEMCSS